MREVYEAACEAAAGAFQAEQDFALANFGEREAGEQAEGDALVRSDLQQTGGEQDARDIGVISCCGACHVATILKA